MADMQVSSSSNSQVLGTDQGSTPAQPARIIPRDFLADLQSAASMVMSPEECAEIAAEIEQIRKPHRAAA